MIKTAFAIISITTLAVMSFACGIKRQNQPDISDNIVRIVFTG